MRKSTIIKRCTTREGCYARWNILGKGEEIESMPDHNFHILDTLDPSKKNEGIGITVPHDPNRMDEMKKFFGCDL